MRFMKTKETGSSRLTRRGFMQRFSVLGAAGAGVGFLAKCGGEAAEEQTAVTGCNDTSGLTAAEIQMREGLGYVDTSPMPEKVCTNCAFWEPAPPNELCGGCQLMAGPIHPDGYCNSWAPIPPEEPAS